LAENYGALIDELLRLKPSSSKGRYFKKVTMSSTNGPGVPVDNTIVKDFTEEA
ncbi:50S ribosomal protein L1, partial [Kytococcus schroeteri]